ncbi:MAG: hypothetical protein COB12_04470 [Flavobacterium sp.]|nr:MAG: hypothetical protein COB12_04470 [Flavobacterium sp.]
MKKIKLYFPLVVVCLLIFSCQKEQLNELNDNNANYSQTSSNNKSENLSITPYGGSDNKAPIDPCLEDRMQWVSYVTTSVLYYEEDARNNFLNTIANNETMALENLIGGSVMSSVFKTKFLEYLYLYSSPEYPQGDLFNACPDGTIDEPLWPPFTTGGDNGGDLIGIDPTQDAVDGFMNYILNENCIELYFPNQLLIYNQESFRVTSTAHPLSTATVNEAYLRYGYLEILEQNCTAVEQFTITQNHIMHPSYNVIVTRPYVSNTCEYTEYSGIDFTEFLSN